MPDHAHSSSPDVQAQLDRLWALSPGADVLGLDRITALLDRLGNPQERLPPVFHVAGTNGKGSTCAFLRAGIEAAGLKCHVYTSPHLVRFNERIRVAGRLIDDQRLATLLSEVLDVADGLSASFFEVTTAVAFLAFARSKADACVIEVGLGGRLDATNVIEGPAVCGITALGIDHQSFLGETLAEIAGEKAGIARSQVPIATLSYEGSAEAAVERGIAERGAVRIRQGRDWAIEGRAYSDAFGSLTLPEPRLAGAHQLSNAGLATAMLRHQRAIAIPDDAIINGIASASWPARLQRLGPGPLVGNLTVWLDGGHNVSAAEALATAFGGQALHLVIGMLANKDAAAFLRTLAPIASGMTAVPIPGHDHHAPANLCELAASLRIPAETAVDVPSALLDRTEPVLITGSLYLAGEVLRLNGEEPQ